MIKILEIFEKSKFEILHSFELIFRMVDNKTFSYKKMKYQILGLTHVLALSYHLLKQYLTPILLKMKNNT